MTLTCTLSERLALSATPSINLFKWKRKQEETLTWRIYSLRFAIKNEYSITYSVCELDHFGELKKNKIKFKFQFEINCYDGLKNNTNNNIPIHWTQRRKIPLTILQPNQFILFSFLLFFNLISFKAWVSHLIEICFSYVVWNFNRFTGCLTLLSPFFHFIIFFLLVVGRGGGR